MDLTKAFEGIARAAEQANALEVGDYLGDDGLYYCRHCNTPKQCRVRNPFVEGKVDIRPCLCKCRIEKKEREEAERARIEFEKRVKELRRAGFPESDMQGWTFENDDGGNAKLTQIMRNYVENFGKMHENGKGLLLYGDTGTGKTYAAACVANALIDKGYPALMTDFTRIVNTLQGKFDGRQEYLDSLNRFPLLIIDDLAAERKTEYMQEIVYSIIDARYRAGLPLIVTTNLTGRELESPSEMTVKRIYSRLYEMCIPVKVEGEDRRRDRLKEDFKEYREMLGI